MLDSNYLINRTDQNARSYLLQKLSLDFSHSSEVLSNLYTVYELVAHTFKVEHY